MRTGMQDGRQWMVTGEIHRPLHIILTHGAGAAMDSIFMNEMAHLLAAKGLTVHRFEFTYMAARRIGGARRPPPRMDVLVSEYLDATADCRQRIGPEATLFIGGKSMGGRVACLAGEQSQPGDVAGIIVLGFPLTPPQKPNASRADVIERLNRPALIVQGTRDPFGGMDSFARLAIPENVAIHWVEDGDHDLKPRRSSGTNPADALELAARRIADFCRSQAKA